MAEVKLYRHLLFRGLGETSRRFRAPGGGSAKAVPPVEDRSGHAAVLRSNLDSAVADMDAYLAAQDDEGVKASERGIPVTVMARPKIALDVGNARSTTRGLKLFNVRRVPEDVRSLGENVDQATFFVTKSVLKSLRENLDRYAEWTDDEDGHAAQSDEHEDGEADRKPRNFRLFESGASIRTTTLRDLWTDALERYPRSIARTKWEVWTRKGFQDSFTNAIGRLGLEQIGRPTEFVEVVVRNIVASPEELQRVVQGSAAVVELRSASSFVADFFDLMPEQKAKTVEEIARRVLPAWPGAPRVALLDTGVNRAHPLLDGSLPSARCHTVEPAWGSTDKQGHGTKMAGLALYGDLEIAANSTSPIALQAALESVVVTAPQAPGDIPARDAMQRAVEMVEEETHPRIFCLAQTAQGEADDGRPTSTSAVLDKLAYGDGISTRLFCAAVGNVRRTATEPYLVADYADRNASHGIESPAQALNALSVGAVSLKEHGNASLLAPVGDLMPTSRTAASWRGSHAFKPDIVMEGGNFYVDDPGLYAHPSPDHLVMTTSREAPANPLAMCCETSAATALASGLGARLMNRYPTYRMETVRGLIVHSAEWTPIMIEHQKALVRSGLSEVEAWRAILDRFGWGVPNEQRLFSSASNALTLIAEDELYPYERPTKNGALQPVRLRQMKYFRLPWPSDVLRALGSTPTELRCTLSYFVEPDPHAASRDRANERYASHRLKIDVKRFGEGHGRAQSRFNIHAPDDGPAASPVPAQDEGWLLSGSVQRGTLVQDVWRGPAFRLAERDGVSIAPIRGWWGDMTDLDNHERPVRFSLIVSIRTPETGGDLMVDVTNRIPAGVLIDGALVDVTT